MYTDQTYPSNIPGIVLFADQEYECGTIKKGCFTCELCDVLVGVNVEIVHEPDETGECTRCHKMVKVYSQGLEFVSNGDGTCYVVGIGDCTDTDIVIPPVSPDGDTVTSIGDNAFDYCQSLTSIDIPSSVISIGNEAFHACKSLTSVVIGNGATSIGRHAFAWCDSLISIVIGNGVTSIGEYAFYGCESLTSIVIPNSVTRIGNDVFNGCESLTIAVIGAGVTNIGDNAFCFCDSLTSILVSDDNLHYKSIDGNLYNKEVTELIQYAIGKPDSNFTIPVDVTSIGKYAFRCCESLTSIEIPDSVTSIGEGAFCGCDSLTSVEVPDSAEIHNLHPTNNYGVLC